MEGQDYNIEYRQPLGFIQKASLGLSWFELKFDVDLLNSDLISLSPTFTTLQSSWNLFSIFNDTKCRTSWTWV